MIRTFFLLAVMMLGLTTLTEAQLRKDLVRPGDYTGAIFRTKPAGDGSWADRLNMTMSHSYSMSFGSYGGQYQNLNAYTNHMAFDLSDNMTGYLDVSILHSPFGGSFLNSGGNGMGARIIIDRAQLDYQLSPRTSLSIQFSQRPGYYGYYGLHSPFHRAERGYWY